MHTKSLESYKTWKNDGSNDKTHRNLYITTNQFKEIRRKFDEQLKSFKKSNDFKYIDGDKDDCDKIISEFKPSNWPAVFTSSENRELLNKICRLFSMYKRWVSEIKFYNDYFNKWNELKGRVFGLTPDEYDVVKQFESSSNALTALLKSLDKDVKETEILENGIRVMTEDELRDQGNRRGGGGGGGSNKRKNVKTRRRNKPAK
jgi:hypothetical protein